MKSRYNKLLECFRFDYKKTRLKKNFSSQLNEQLNLAVVL